MTKTYWFPKFNPFNKQVISWSVTVSGMQFCFPILTFTLAKLVPKLLPVMLIKDDAFRIFGATLLIKGVIGCENSKTHAAAKQTARTFFDVTIIWLLTFVLAFVVRIILLYVIFVLNVSLLTNWLLSFIYITVELGRNPLPSIVILVPPATEPILSELHHLENMNTERERERKRVLCS